MKEKYNSEKDLGNAFDNFEMPFDSNAFDAFKTELDKEDHRRKFIWWKFYGRIFTSVILLGFLIVGFIYLSDFKDDSKLSSANSVNINSVYESFEIKKEDNKSIELKNMRADQKEEKNIKGLSRDGDNHFKISNDDRSISTAMRSKGKNVDIENNDGLTNKTNGILNNNIPLLKETLSQEDANVLRIKEQISSTSGLNEIMKVEHENHHAVVIAEVEDIALLGLITRIDINRLSRIKIGILTDPVTLLKEKYKAHFYFNVGAGMSIDDNFGQSDPFFDGLKPIEYVWYGSVSYQFSNNTALELGLMRKNLTMGFQYSESFFLEKVGNKVSILSARLINKIWSPSQRVNFNMSNGVALVKASSEFNEGFDFGFGVSGMGDPEITNNVTITWDAMYSKNHFMYSGGLSMDYEIAKNLELTFGAEYTLGFKPIMKANLQYVAGEGMIKKTETSSNASYALFTLGVKYRLRKD